MSQIKDIKDIEEDVLEEVDIVENQEEVTEEEVIEEEVNTDVLAEQFLPISDIMEYAKATKTPLELFTGDYTKLSELNAVVLKERTRVTALMESTPTPQPTKTGGSTVTLTEAEKVAAYETAIDNINTKVLGG